MDKKEQEIQKEREKRYGGKTTFNHENLGIIWTGILQNYFRIKLPAIIPAHIVLLMFSASKINRAVSEVGIPDNDNYDDGKIYLELAKNAKKEKAVDKGSRPEESDSPTS